MTVFQSEIKKEVHGMTFLSPYVLPIVQVI